jgi:hypothetical protein
MMRILKTAAMTLALAMPGVAMAADGPLGPTSSASFTASLTITPDTSNYVQIVGLDNINLATWALGTVQNISASDFFCVNRNTPGSVMITITDQDGPFGLHNGAGQSASAAVTIVDQIGAGTGSGTGAQVFVTPSSPAGCNASSTGASQAHQIVITSEMPPSVGTWTGNFTVLLQPN